MTEDERSAAGRLLVTLRSSLDWIEESEAIVADLLRQLRLGVPPREVDFAKHETALKESQRQVESWRRIADQLAQELDCEYRK